MNTDLYTDTASAHAIFQSYGGMEGLAETFAVPAQPLRPGGAHFSSGYIPACWWRRRSPWPPHGYRSSTARRSCCSRFCFGIDVSLPADDGRMRGGDRILMRGGVTGRRGVAGACVSRRRRWRRLAGACRSRWWWSAWSAPSRRRCLAARLLGFRALFRRAVRRCGRPSAVSRRPWRSLSAALPRASENGPRIRCLTVVGCRHCPPRDDRLSDASRALGLALIAMPGSFLGATIHDVAQVVGAGYTLSPQTGDVATHVKLMRVTMLLPVVFSIAFIVGRRGKGRQGGTRRSFHFS